MMPPDLILFLIVSCLIVWGANTFVSVNVNADWLRLRSMG